MGKVHLPLGGMMRRAIAGALAVVLAVGILGGCYEGNPNGKRVAVIGDSIGYLSVPWFRWYLQTGGYAYQFAVESGAGSKWGADALRRLDHDPQGRPEYVVWEFGTNDVWRWPGRETEVLARIFNDVLAGRRCTVFVNVAWLPSQAQRMRGREINRLIDFLDWISPHVAQVDWHWLSQFPGTISADGVHPTEHGADMLAGNIRWVLDHDCP